MPMLYTRLPLQDHLLSQLLLLQIAKAWNRVDIGRLLLDHGASPWVADCWGRHLKDDSGLGKPSEAWCTMVDEYWANDGKAGKAKALRDKGVPTTRVHV
jgi:hypothetical protein